MCQFTQIYTQDCRVISLSDSEVFARRTTKPSHQDKPLADALFFNFQFLYGTRCFILDLHPWNLAYIISIDSKNSTWKMVPFPRAHYFQSPTSPTGQSAFINHQEPSLNVDAKQVSLPKNRLTWDVTTYLETISSHILKGLIWQIFDYGSFHLGSGRRNILRFFISIYNLIPRCMVWNPKCATNGWAKHWAVARGPHFSLVRAGWDQVRFPTDMHMYHEWRYMSCPIQDVPEFLSPSFLLIPFRSAEWGIFKAN